MKYLNLIILLLASNIIFSQSATLEYSHVEIKGMDTINIKSNSVIMFSRQTLIIQNEDRRVNTYLVPGSEFDKLNVSVFDDTNMLLESDSLSKTIIYGSINYPVEIGVEVNESIVPKSEYDHFKLQENDKIEIISAVGGG